MRLFLVILLFGLQTGHLSGQSLRGVARDLEKKEYDKVNESLSKLLEKDPANAGAKYYKSILLVDPAYEGYHVDSAYFFINQALEDYTSLEEKEMQKLTRDEVVLGSLEQQKLKVEGLGFEQALEVNSIDGYALFIEKFSSAGEIPEALSNRNKIAFSNAVNEDSFQGYQEFIRTYPEAEQVPEAEKRYEARLFEAETRDGKLDSFVEFLKDNPQTPYRDQIEGRIFEIQTAGHSIENYLAYIQAYPESKAVSQAVNRMYHLAKEQGRLDDFINFGYSNDSLDQTIELEKETLVNIYESGKFGFINTFGDVVIDPVLDKLPEDYLCELVKGDILILAGYTLARNGSVAYSEGFETASDLGGGLLKIEVAGKFGVIHKNGLLLVPPRYSDVQLLAGRFIKVKKDDLWGIRSVTDLEILELNYDNIDTYGEFIAVERNGRLAITNGAELERAADQVALDLDFQYDEVELLRDQYLLGYSGDREALINTQLDYEFELLDQEILDLDNYWIVQQEDQDQVHLYNLRFESLSKEPFQEILHNEAWLALQSNNKWALQNQTKEFKPDYQYSLVKLLSPGINLVFKGDKSYVLFGAGDTLETTGLTVQIVKPASAGLEDHLLTTDNKGVRRLYGPKGNKILGGRFDQVAVLSNNLFLIDENGRKGLSDSSGQNVLPINNDAIGDFYEGSVSVLRGGKFGLFHYPTKTVIDPEYQKQLEPYNSRLFVASKNGQKGLINLKEKRVLEFQYDEIEYWSDTVALAKAGDRWQFLSLGDYPVDTSSFEIIEYVENKQDSKTIIYHGNHGMGVKSNIAGDIIETGFDDITLLEDSEPIYIAVKSIPQAEYYAIVYFGMEGNHFWRQAVTKQEYNKMTCNP